MKVIKFMAAIGAAYLNVLRPSYVMFGVLILINFGDYVTGILKALSNEEKITVARAYQGIAIKLNRLFFVLVALSIDIMIDQYFKLETAITPVSAAVIAWLCLNELLSICSNISNNGKVKIPPVIQEFLDKYIE